jgi:hypothetical protein
MNWNNCTFEASLLMVELEENVPFYDSAISLNLGLTNVDGSPMLQDPHVKGFIKSFEKFGSRAGVEIDNPVPLLKDLPGIFITAPAPVWMPQPSGPSAANGASCRTLTTFRSPASA